MLFHPSRLFAALRQARAEASDAASRAEASATRTIEACKTVKRNAAAKCEELDSGVWNGPWMIATPLDQGRTRGGGSPPPSPT